ncbi:MAG: MFS transporter [Pseudomonadota bacterium]|nr:MFS transporter [Pseudomonadota bacterium]
MKLLSRFNPMTHALGDRNYLIYTVGNICSHFGMWAYRIALQWLTWKLTGSTFWLGAIALADLFPTVVLAPLAGAITERVNRLGMMRFAMAFTTLQATILAFFCLDEFVSIEKVFSLTLVLGLVLAINHPVRLVIVPNMVNRQRLASAVAINSLVFNVARVGGPAIAGGIIALSGEEAWVVGVGIVFAFNAVASAIFAVALIIIRLGAHALPRSLAPLKEIPNEIKAGFKYTFSHPGIGVLMFVLFIVGVFGRTYIDLFSGFVDSVFGLGPDALGILVSSVGLGAVMGGFWLAQRGQIKGLTSIVISNILILAVVLIIFASTTKFYIAVGSVFVAGFSMTVAGTGEQTLIQAAVDDYIRGRVISLYGAVSRGCPSLGSLLMGWAGDYVGLRWPVIFGAVICICLWFWTFKRRDDLKEALENPPVSGVASKKN